MPLESKYLDARFAVSKVLVVDDEAYMRKVVRALLMSIGVRTIYEAADGVAGLDAIRTMGPDLVIVDWEMPGLDGPGFIRMVRSPDTFPFPDVPIIMLTGHGERARVLEAMETGVNEFLLKPVSSKALRDRMIAVLARPRPMIRRGDYYGPAPRKLSQTLNEANDAVANLVLLN
ncbi:MAG: response regulator [Pseudolabrys sp.]|nr:response regulator [Pseudolabrys sp.]MBV9954591.1 response regulator [Pseudolabrys sp.]